MSAIEVDALFQAMDLVVGRIVYLASVSLNSTSRISFDVGHYISVEVASAHVDYNRTEVCIKVFMCIYISHNHKVCIYSENSQF